MALKLKIGYFYPELLNLYGDNGNIEILVSRAKQRDIDVEVVPVDVTTKLSAELLSGINLVFMGGGPDSGQKELYQDLVRNKKEYLNDYINNSGLGLYICGAYQLLGKYYKASDGSILEGLGIFDLFTEHFGATRPRCIGNTYAKLSENLTSDSLFPHTSLGDFIVGFENHGGRTYLGKTIKPFAKVIKGYGNNAEDLTEGAQFKNSIGTYFHGPILSKNPHLADYLIFKALNISLDALKTLPQINDNLIIAAHSASKNLKQ